MRVLQKIVCAALLGVTLSAWSTATLGAQTSIAERETVARVQKALERLPYYGVFDFLAFGVDRGTVTIFGSRFPNMQPVGMYPIHIIVKNLRTTLLGTVETDLDRTLASNRARTVPGVLNVDVEVMVARDL